MHRKRASIILHTLQHQRPSEQPFNSNKQIFQYIQTCDLPSIIQQKILSADFKDKKVIKTLLYPHGFIVSFYVAFLKFLFVQRTAFEKCVQKLFEILDNDEFTIQMVKEKNSPLYLDWSKSKMKRMTSEYFKQILIEEYQSVYEILIENPDFNKILFLVSWSLLFNSQRVEKFDEFVEFGTVKEVLFDYFGIEAYQNEDSIVIPDSSILIECFDDTDIYVIDLPNFQSQLEQDTSKSIHINYAMGDLELASELKLTLDLNIFGEDEEKNMTKTRNFRDMTNRTYEKNQNLEKTLRFKEIRFNTIKDTDIFQEDSMNEPNKNNYQLKTQAENTRLRSRGMGDKFKIEQLLGMAHHRTTTQKSLYDETPLSDADQYSVLDISIPTSKKINEKSLNKENQELNDMAQSIKPHESLIGKWYEFCKTKQSKGENIQSKILKLNKNGQKKLHFQETNEKPDFRKVKSRRRKSQDVEQEGYSSQNRPLSMNKRQPSELTSQDNSSCLQKDKKKQKQREYIIQGPRAISKGENIYSKFGYLNMNISEEFTDSLILKELEQKNVEVIRTIKEKAREKRKIIRTIIEQAEKEADIDRL